MSGMDAALQFFVLPAPTVTLPLALRLRQSSVGVRARKLPSTVTSPLVLMKLFVAALPPTWILPLPLTWTSMPASVPPNWARASRAYPGRVNEETKLASSSGAQDTMAGSVEPSGFVYALSRVSVEEPSKQLVPLRYALWRILSIAIWAAASAPAVSAACLRSSTVARTFVSASARTAATVTATTVMKIRARIRVAPSSLRRMAERRSENHNRRLDVMRSASADRRG